MERSSRNRKSSSYGHTFATAPVDSITRLIACADRNAGRLRGREGLRLPSPSTPPIGLKISYSRKCQKFRSRLSGTQRGVNFREGLRSCAHGTYVIFFTVDDQGVRIERILHGARDLGPLLNQ
ncbi:type II toxin-antitoxin system RelE/ParE family toxin [Povalibacter sp.]|uniref:type II toxin-antitoxin system RelE/ParE family toxin n=1 Tax=Povalibacter sp. TaxID=1962978 RepID=UPI0032C22010